MTNTKKILVLSIFISQALVLSIIERGIPIPLLIPGIKLGLANIISLFVIIIFGFREALIIVTLRVLLSSMFVGGVTGFLYSITGGFMSTIIMSFIYNNFKSVFSIVAISVVGAVFHNIGQILMASIVINDTRLFYYLPALMISGVITGLFIGFTAKYSIEPMKKILKL